MAYVNNVIDSSKISKYTMFVKEITVMSFENYFPLWNDLNTAQKKVIIRTTEEILNIIYKYKGNV